MSDKIKMVRVRNISDANIQHGIQYKLKAHSILEEVPEDIAKKWKSIYPDSILIGEEADANVIENKNNEIESLRAENESLKKELEQKQDMISKRDVLLDEKDAEIAKLKEQLEKLGSKEEEQQGQESADERKALFAEAKSLNVEFYNSIPTEELKKRVEAKKSELAELAKKANA